MTKLLKEFKDILVKLVTDINLGESDLTQQDIEHLKNEITCICNNKRMYIGDVAEYFNIKVIDHINDYILLGKLPLPHIDSDGINYWYKKELKDCIINEKA